MGDDVTLPTERTSERKTITDGFFEREVYLSREETATFLRDLADSIEEGNTLTISSREWELPFEYREPIEVEIEFTDHRERELEVELEFTEPKGGSDLHVK